MRLQEWVREATPRYTQRARELERVTRGIPSWDVGVFVLCTPLQTYEAAVTQWHTWHAEGCKRMRGSFGNRRTRQANAILGKRLRRRVGEPTHAWEARIAALDGFGPVKAPFLMCLLEPLAKDVPVCVDRWVMRGLGFQADIGSVSRVRGAQRIVAFMSESARVRPFVWQWMAWDWWRSAGAAIQPLFVKETDIARDLLSR